MNRNETSKEKEQETNTKKKTLLKLTLTVWVSIVQNSGYKSELNRVEYHKITIRRKTGKPEPEWWWPTRARTHSQKVKTTREWKLFKWLLYFIVISFKTFNRCISSRSISNHNSGASLSCLHRVAIHLCSLGSVDRLGRAVVYRCYVCMHIVCVCAFFFLWSLDQWVLFGFYVRCSQRAQQIHDVRYDVVGFCVRQTQREKEPARPNDHMHTCTFSGTLVCLMCFIRCKSFYTR